jgi:hypothetical protein
MKTLLSKIVAICLAAMAAYGSQSPTPTGQQADAQRPATQQSSPETTPQVEMKFRLLSMPDGFTKDGFRFGGLTYEAETANQIMVYVYMVHLGSREGAKKEYDDRLSGALKIIEQGKTQDKPASRPATTEDRAVIVVPTTAAVNVVPSTTKDCKELFTILATAGTVLRIHQSCSLEAVIAWEKGARHNETVNDRFVVR